MEKFKIYLAGKMSGLTFEQMNTWRMNANLLFKDESDNKIHTINPCEYYNFEIDSNTYTEKEIMKFDLHMVKQSDLILVNLEYPDTIGTAIELFHASEVLHKPVIGFGLKVMVPHPWMMLCVDKMCVTLEDAVDYILDFYLPNI